MCFGQAIIPVNTGNNSSSFTNAMFNNTLGIPNGVNSPASTFYRPGNLFYFTGIINKLAVYDGSVFRYLLTETDGAQNYIKNQSSTPQVANFNITGTARIGRYMFANDSTITYRDSAFIQNVRTNEHPTTTLTIGLNAGKVFKEGLAGYANTLIGYESGLRLKSDVIGEARSNILLGYRAGQFLTVGTGNTVIGTAALGGLTATNIKGSVILGWHAGRLMTQGDYSVALGYNTLSAQTANTPSTAVGNEALTRNTTGEFNTAVGALSQFAGTTGSYNTSTGHAALNNYTGSYSAAFGYRSGVSNVASTGFNSFFGAQAGETGGNGHHNTFIGFRSGNTSTGDYNTYLGAFSNVTGNFDRSIMIGYKSTASANQRLNIGNAIYGIGVDTVAVTNGLFGVNNPTPTVAWDVVGKIKASVAPSDPTDVVRKTDLDNAVTGLVSTASGGLTKVGTDVKLGGTLTPSVITNIELGIGGLNISRAGFQAGRLVVGTTDASLGLGSSVSNSPFKTGINISTVYGVNKFRVVDSTYNEGMVYSGDYSTNGKKFNRWIPDWGNVKARVDSMATAIGAGFIQNQTAIVQGAAFRVSGTTFHEGGIQSKDFVRVMRGSFGIDIQSPVSLSGYFNQSLQPAAGVIALTVQPGDIEITDATKGIILRSPNNARWRITVSDAGVLTAVSLP